MKPDTTTDYDPVPEGLEFDERYMDAAFSMYEAEKKERKRRILIWIWSSSAGMAATLLLITLFSVHNDPKHVIASTKALKGSSSDYPKENNHEQTATTSRLERKKQTSLREKHASQITFNTAASPSINKSTSGALLNKRTSGLNPSVDAYLNQPENVFVQPIAVIQRALKSQQGIMQTNGLKLRSTDNSSGLTAELPSNDSSDSSKTLDAHHPPLDPQADHQFFISTGINTLFGMSELKTGFHMRETVGFTYNYSFNKFLKLSTEAELYTLPGITHYQTIDTDSPESGNIFLTKTSLHYLTIAPKLDVTFQDRHHFAIGGGMEYLVINPGDKYEIRNYTGDKITNDNSNYYQTFNRFNFFVSFGYGIDLTQRFALYGTYNLGLSDITVNSTTFTAFDRNSRFQLMLRMRIH